MQKFISCDWGTSALRLRIIDTNSISVLAVLKDRMAFSIWVDNFISSGITKGPDNSGPFYFHFRQDGRE